MTPLAVFIGGGLGALSRYGVALLAKRLAPLSAFPWGTLVVNLAGCFVLGLLARVFSAKAGLPAPLTAGLTTGFLGGLTTFSTFGVETTSLMMSAESHLGLLNLLANVVFGLALAWLGMRLGAQLIA